MFPSHKHFSKGVFFFRVTTRIFFKTQESERSVAVRAAERAVHSSEVTRAASGGGAALQEFVVERLQATNSQLRRQLCDFKQLLRSSLQAAQVVRRKGTTGAELSGAVTQSAGAASQAARGGKSVQVFSPPRRELPLAPPFAQPVERKQLELAQRRAANSYEENQRLRRELERSKDCRVLAALATQRDDALREVERLRCECRALQSVQRSQTRALHDRAQRDAVDFLPRDHANPSPVLSCFILRKEWPVQFVYRAAPHGASLGVLEKGVWRGVQFTIWSIFSSPCRSKVEHLEAQLRVAHEQARRAEARTAETQRGERGARARAASLAAELEEVSAGPASSQLDRFIIIIRVGRVWS